MTDMEDLVRRTFTDRESDLDGTTLPYAAVAKRSRARNRRRLAITAGAVAVVAVLAGGAVALADRQPETVPASSPHCPATPLPDPPAGEPVPADFTVAYVIRCGEELRPVRGDGTWFFRIEQRADTDAAALLAALRARDVTPSPGGTTCLDALRLPWFALVDAEGRVLHPRVPLDACGNPQQAVVDAFAALSFREVAATRLNQEQSQQSIATGCGQMWGDSPTDEELAADRPAADRRLWRKTPDTVLICLWRNRTTGNPQLTSAKRISGSALAALLARLDALPAARACTAQNSTFAVLQYFRRGWNDAAAYLETDGCRRIQRPDTTLGQLDAAAVAELVRLGGG